jgi:hypothetical protein
MKKTAGCGQDMLTPDRRYIVVRGRLWRAANPGLPAKKRRALTHELMSARREIAAARRGADPARLKGARARVHAAKLALGERGPAWWKDGAPDYNRHLVKNTPYAPWYRTRTGEGAVGPGGRSRRSARPARC